MRYAGELLSLFGRQKWIVLLRDGRETVASMADHPTFAYGLVKRERPSLLSQALKRLKDGARGSDILGWEPFARSWVSQVTEQLRLLEEGAEEGTVCRVSFEELLVHPRQELERLVKFVGAKSLERDWLDAAAGRVRRPTSKFSLLGATDQAVIERFCRPGLLTLGY